MTVVVILAEGVVLVFVAPVPIAPTHNTHVQLATFITGASVPESVIARVFAPVAGLAKCPI